MDANDGGRVAQGTVPIANAESVIRTMIHPGAKACYKHGLASDRTQFGMIVILIRVAPNGDVDAVSVPSNIGLSNEVANCIADVARRARFDAPGPSGSQISVPFNFEIQQSDGSVLRRLSDGGVLRIPPATGD